MRLCWVGAFAFSKRLFFGEDCLKVISETAQEVGRVAGVTLGPLGRNVVIEDHKQLPRITRDGVTVVKHLQYEDRLKDAVCTLIKRSVGATNRFAGDGTTTSTLLIAELLSEGRKILQTGVNPREVKMGLQIGRDIGLQFIRAASRKAQSQQQWRQVAMIATKGDQQLSGLIVEALSKAKLIKVERGSLSHSYVQFYGGVKVGAGLVHPQFKNRGDKLQLDYPLVVIDTVGISRIEQVVKVMELAKKARKPILIISSAISDSVLSTLIYNLRKGIVQAYPLIIKDVGSKAQEYFKQLAQTTGAVIFDRYGPSPITEVDFQQLGQAVRVEMDEFQTSITGRGSQQYSNATIYAGGANEAIALEVQDKLVDALNSVQTAQRHGVIAGGGVTYWRIAQLLESYEGESTVGVRLLARALRAPRRMLEGEWEGGLRGEEWEGLDFKTGKVRDMFEAGVVDSAIVGESVLVDSVSLAQLLLDVSVCIVRRQDNSQGSKQVRSIEETYRI